MRFSVGGKILMLDGAMGSLLQAQGLPVGASPDEWCLSNPERVTAVHSAYLHAGADVILTNTFGVSPLKMPENRVREIIFAAVGCVRAAQREAGRDCVIALDVGPTGRMLSPLGDLTFEDAVAAYRTVAAIGSEAGADLIFIETMGDLNEARAAVIGAKEGCNLPIAVSFAFGSDGRLFTGSSPEIVAATMSSMGVAMLGANCSTGPSGMLDVAERLLAYSTVPVSIKPNAGMPRLDGKMTVYDVSPTQFASQMRAVAELGLAAVGGCCGTDPEYISALKKAVCDIAPTAKREAAPTAVTSYSRLVDLDLQRTVIGERINPTGKKQFKEALRRDDLEYILREAIGEEQAGCHLLDVNVGLPDIDEPQMMLRAVSELQTVTTLPLVIDTSDPVTMEAALRVYNGKALVNSVSGKKDSMAAVLPLVKKYGGAVICITLDEDGIPESAEKRVEIAERIAAAAREYGIAKSNLLIDPLCMTVSTDSNAAKETLRAVRMLTDLGYKTSLGISNVSFGLPDRDGLNAAFLTMALTGGLSCAIVNPYSEKIMTAIAAYNTLSGLDPDCSLWVAKSGERTETAALMGEDCTLSYAIEHGMRDVAAELTVALLAQKAALDVINSEIVPALDRVGVSFERGSVYLPSLISAAEAASAAFEVIKSRTEKKNDKERCTVVIATVEGDIHDIGKNIVKLLLENYGFNVVDLGRDVPPERVLAATLEHSADIVALSALMTTTVPAMAKTVALVKKEAPRVKIIVGGAVLTEDYAALIGADAYAPDAMGAVRYAESVCKDRI